MTEKIRKLVKEELRKFLNPVQTHRKIYLKEFFNNIDHSKLEILYNDYNKISKAATFSNPVTFAMFRGIVINESLTRTYPIDKTISYIKSYFNLEPEQIVKKHAENGIEFIGVFIPNINENIKLMKKAMLYCGYFLGYPKNTEDLPKDEIVELQFEPKFQNDITEQLHKEESVLYHITPVYNSGKIEHIGFSPRCKNELFDFPNRVYFIRGSIGKDNAVIFGDELNNKNNSLGNNGKYVLYAVDLSKVPKEIKFYPDPNYRDGVFTLNNISPKTILYKEMLNYLK